MTVIRTTAFFLIVLTISPESNYAGSDEPHQTMCECSRSQRVAMAEPVDSLVNQKVQLPLAIQPEAAKRKWVYVVIHHSATSAGSVEGIHDEHRQRRDSVGNLWLGIGYHFVIGNGNGMPDGQIEATFRWKQQLHGAHSGSAVHNANGIGICLIGNFEEKAPTAEQLKSITKLVESLTRQHNIPARLVIGHNTVKPTACPGRHFPLQDVVRKAMTDGS